MPANPYESPKSTFDEPTVTDGRRRQAFRRVRAVFAILLLPAIYNYYCFDTQAFGGSGIGLPVHSVYRTINVLALIICGALIWCFGLPVLEWVSNLIRVLFAPRADPDAWNGVLYDSLPRAVLLSIPGAILWALWVFGLYQLEIDFLTISYAVGIPANILGACFYLPLFYRWYRLNEDASFKEQR
jgi:hypothetical protein